MMAWLLVSTGIPATFPPHMLLSSMEGKMSARCLPHSLSPFSSASTSTVMPPTRNSVTE